MKSAKDSARYRLHKIGEDISERLDIIPAQFRVLVMRRPKYGCRACEDVVVQMPAPARLIEGGLPTEATVAQVLVSKYADHLPLYRQSQIYARQGIALDRSTVQMMGMAVEEMNVDLNMKNTKLKTALRALVGQYNLTYVISDGHLVITTEEAAVTD